MAPNLEVDILTKKALIEALNQTTYWHKGWILMPKSKVYWLATNDRISDDAICAIVCTQKDQIISYILTIPDTIQLKDGTKHDVNWLHEWWVDKSYHGTIVSSFVFNKAVKALGYKVLIESNAENAEVFLNRYFNTISKKKRSTIFFMLNKNILSSKLPITKHLGSVINLINSTGIKFINYLNFKKTQRCLTGVTYEYVNVIDTESWKFLKPLCENDFSYKTQNYISWLLDNKQYLQTPSENRFPFKFSTTGFSKGIYNHSLKIIKNNKIIGFISYLFNVVDFNVRFFVVNEQSNYPIVLAALMEHMLRSGAHYIITDDAQLSKEINKTYKTLFTYKQIKTAKAHKRMDLNFEDIVLTDRDGRFH